MGCVREGVTCEAVASSSLQQVSGPPLRPTTGNGLHCLYGKWPWAVGVGTSDVLASPEEPLTDPVSDQQSQTRRAWCGLAVSFSGAVCDEPERVWPTQDVEVWCV